MPLDIDPTQYELYQEGKAAGLAEVRAASFEKGKLIAKEEFVERNLKMKILSDSEIARVSGFTLEKIQSIRDRIEKDAGK